MNIIIEGPDNSGKSTLLEHMAESLPVFKTLHSGGPPKDDEEMESRVKDYLSRDLTLFDRHPCISDPIYGRHREYSPIKSEWVEQLYASHPILVFCVPRGLGDHVIKERDTPEHIALVEQNFREICQEYREWAMSHALIIYRVGDDMDLTLNLVKEAIRYDRQRNQRDTRPI